ncbi:hypothetical protein HKX48_004330 [Thoreauomyces humboldtii]|nr:hypothetical protein HKX48_004330 [Thoreauomyces humboldtii]
MSTNYKFAGWVSKDKHAIGNMVWEEYEPKRWTEDDVDIQITHCGICASDLHTASSGWGETDYPTVVGHEIVGKIVRIGSNVKNLAIGDRVGVGAQSGSCRNCIQCKEDLEPYCDGGMTGTYNGRFPESQGAGKSYGGYADYSRVPAHFAIKIPDSVPSDIAAPMMCGGVTVYSPLKQLEAGPGKRIGIIGIGGLGHFGLLFAKALGAEPVAISHSSSKKADAEKMGAVHFISTHDDPDWIKNNKRTLDGIICTVNHHDMPLSGYSALLKPGKQIIMVGLPEKPLTDFSLFPLIFSNISIAGSLIGSPKVIREMLELAVKSDVKTWVQLRDLKEVNQATVDQHDGKAKYRYVLVNSKHAHL